MTANAQTIKAQSPGGATLQEAYEATALRSKTPDPVGDYHKLLVASVSAVIPRRTREHAQSVLDEIWVLARALHAAHQRGREDAAKVCDKRSRASGDVLKTCEFLDGEVGESLRLMNATREQEARECAAAIRAGGA